jgi:hypothetical protein
VLAYRLPLFAIASIPLWFGMPALYHRTHSEFHDPASSHYDSVLAGQRPYLNTPFFAVRMVIYFVAWTYMSYKLYDLSVRQDVDPEGDIPARQRTVSAWGIPVLALTSAFASYDLIMSLDPHWFSTIFGVYFFAGSFLAALCVMTLASLLYRRGGHLREAITKEHYHDLGKWIFGFVIFWAYIGFSQYMLYWYGNIPEEIAWFQHRTTHGWNTVSRFLIWGHFVIPFFVLLPRFTKRLLPNFGGDHRLGARHARGRRLLDGHARPRDDVERTALARFLVPAGPGRHLLGVLLLPDRTPRDGPGERPAP